MNARGGWGTAGFILLGLAWALPMTPPQDQNVDPVGRLRDRINAGQVTLSFDSVTGFLPSLLAALDIQPSSQGLVFSRTSLQTNLIAPWSPRAIYFNDNVYIGYVVDSPFLEISAINPGAGSVFYTLNQNPDTVVIQAEGQTCLMCHDSRLVTGGVPGVMVRSVIPDRNGYPITVLGRGATTDRTPMSERLGGWYVTGSVPAIHAGNRAVPELNHEIFDKERYRAEFERSDERQVNSLTGRFDTSPYLTEHSDVVALLVLTHQTRVHNLITLTGEAVREALRRQRSVELTTGVKVEAGTLLPAARAVVVGAVDRLVDAMLFAEAAPLGGPIEGSTSFTREFEQRGPLDSRGRSLRQFDLNGRLFLFPLSFLIYSDAFDVLPPLAKDMIYAGVEDLLVTGTDPRRFPHLSPEVRSAIHEILVETKPEFAEYVKSKN
jgi:hypothetical protein